MAAAGAEAEQRQEQEQVREEQDQAGARARNALSPQSLLQPHLPRTRRVSPQEGGEAPPPLQELALLGAVAGAVAGQPPHWRAGGEGRPAGWRGWAGAGTGPGEGAAWTGMPGCKAGVSMAVSRCEAWWGGCLGRQARRQVCSSVQQQRHSYEYQHSDEAVTRGPACART